MGRKVKAAGGVVLRRVDGGEIEAVVVHRPRYDDWTLPKGKREAGEKARDCALREVEEETGLRCSALGELPRSGYQLPTGETKVVRWWLMAVIEDFGFRANDEVDKIRWVKLSEIGGVLTHDSDVTVVRHSQSSPPVNPGNS